MQRVNIFWFRRDLRLFDNTALFHALTSGRPVVPVFIFDTKILDQLPDKNDRRVAFIHAALELLQTTLAGIGSTLHTYSGSPRSAFEQLLKRYSIESVFVNHDYEPYALRRDEEISSFLKESATSFHSYKDQVIFEKNDIVRENKRPYLVFTPYSNQWKKRLSGVDLLPIHSEKYLSNLLQQPLQQLPSLQQLGFRSADKLFPGDKIDRNLIRNYAEKRERPGIEGTSRLGVHLRFGTRSIRSLVSIAIEDSSAFLNELIWREFFQMILYHFPYVGQGSPFKKDFETMEWRNNEVEFSRWCEGKTGYPIVDAGMRELNNTGYMHNRVRMITASFLCKHLLVDWRWGEAYFAEKLLDFELASNNGNWQWVAGSGVDAAPFFRIFNPALQAQKYDPEYEYIKRWVPEFNTPAYPRPIVEHEMARQRALDAYKKIRINSQEARSLW